MTRMIDNWNGEANVWRAVIEDWKGNRAFYGPYANRGPATQAMKKALRKDLECKGSWWGPDEEVPPCEPLPAPLDVLGPLRRWKEHYPDDWRPAEGYLEYVTNWARDTS